ncbi:hypothetical protein Sjap_008975 [Stephania japonica]|uniref:Uncharacterized protein n=1 Tax=Stephania japonica TaxID=461633 RepID=A0AAP0JQJ9_9MAGN
MGIVITGLTKFSIFLRSADGMPCIQTNYGEIVKDCFTRINSSKRCEPRLIGEAALLPVKDHVTCLNNFPSTYVGSLHIFQVF